MSAWQTVTAANYGPPYQPGRVPRFLFKGITRTKLEEIKLAVHRHQLGNRASEEVEGLNLYAVTRSIAGCYVSHDSNQTLPRWKTINYDIKISMIQDLEKRFSWLSSFQGNWGASLLLGKHINSKSNNIRYRNKVSGSSRMEPSLDEDEDVNSINPSSSGLGSYPEEEVGDDSEEFNGFSDSGSEFNGTHEHPDEPMLHTTSLTPNPSPLPKSPMHLSCSYPASESPEPRAHSACQLRQPIPNPPPVCRPRFLGNGVRQKVYCRSCDARKDSLEFTSIRNKSAYSLHCQSCQYKRNVENGEAPDGGAESDNLMADQEGGTQRQAPTIRAPKRAKSGPKRASVSSGKSLSETGRERDTSTEPPTKTTKSRLPRNVKLTAKERENADIMDEEGSRKRAKTARRQKAAADKASRTAAKKRLAIDMAKAHAVCN